MNAYADFVADRIRFEVQSVTMRYPMTASYSQMRGHKYLVVLQQPGHARGGADAQRRGPA
jgi:hypothetical protein